MAKAVSLCILEADVRGNDGKVEVKKEVVRPWKWGDID